MKNRTPFPLGLPEDGFSVRQGREAGLSGHQLRSSELLAPYYGVRVRGAGPSGLLARCRAYAPRLRPTEFFSHETALRLWGAPLRGSDTEAPLHVSVFAPGRATRERHVIGHQLVPRRIRVLRRAGLRLCDPETAWLLGARSLSVPELVAAGDALILRPRFAGGDSGAAITTRERLAQRLRGARGLGVRFAGLALPLLREGAESRMESLLRLLLVGAGLPEPVLQFPVVVRSAGGRPRRVGRFDLAYPRQRVLVEYDGEQHRLDDRQYALDLIRLDRARDAGYRVIRVLADGVFARPDRTVARVRSALAAHP